MYHEWAHVRKLQAQVGELSARVVTLEAAVGAHHLQSAAQVSVPPLAMPREREKHGGLWSHTEEPKLVECTSMISLDDRDWIGIANYIGTGRKPNYARQHYKMMLKKDMVNKLE